MRAVAERLDSIFTGLITRVAACTVLLPLLLPFACTRLQRARTRILAILHRLAEGTWRAPRPHTPRNPALPPRRRTPAPHLPRRHAWLGHVTDHHVRGHASQLTHLLNDPATQAILARAPATARAAIARALKGPARLLGLDLPNMFQFAGPPRPCAPRPVRPRPARPQGVLPTDRPIPGNVLAYSRFNRRRFGNGA